MNNQKKYVVYLEDRHPGKDFGRKYFSKNWMFDTKKEAEKCAKRESINARMPARVCLYKEVADDIQQMYDAIAEQKKQAELRKELAANVAHSV